MQRIVVDPYNPEWPIQFETLYAVIWPHISDMALALEHVGSTSVPGLAAKPVIDLTIIAPDQENLTIIIDRLASLGIKHRGDLGIIGREAFSPLPHYPQHHLYACISNSQALRNHIAIRDALRSDAELAQSYGDLKLSLARKYAYDMDAYVEGKSTFLISILRISGFSEDDLDTIEIMNRKPQ